MENYLAFAQYLADEAANISLSYFRTRVPREIKADDSPVTLADKSTEAHLRTLIKHHYPQHSIIGEEHGEEQTPSPFTWVIDPIDGTKAFISGFPTYTTLIALCYENTPIIGIIDQPLLKERWVGENGQPTRFNGAEILPAPSPEALHQAIIGTTDPYLFPEGRLEAYRRLKEACAHQICGGDAYLYGRAALGLPHIVAEYGLKAHDFAALLPVLRGAGKVVKNWAGQDVEMDNDNGFIVTANETLMEQALGILQA